jgi:hypothetical protein
MPRPVFYLQIVDRDGIVVEPFPGGGALERDLIDACTRAILAKGVGFKPSAHVEQDIRDGMAEAILDLKRETIPLAGHAS